jgi:hypothetical protein
LKNQKPDRRSKLTRTLTGDANLTRDRSIFGLTGDLELIADHHIVTQNFANDRRSGRPAIQKLNGDRR